MHNKGFCGNTHKHQSHDWRSGYVAPYFWWHCPGRKKCL